MEINKTIKAMEECMKQSDDKQKAVFCRQLDDLQVERGRIVKPKVRILEDKPDTQFTPDGKRVIETLFWYLWDNKDIQNTFIDDYFIKKCHEHFNRKEQKEASELIEMVVHDLFIENTAQFPLWRVVEI